MSQKLDLFILIGNIENERKRNREGERDRDTNNKNKQGPLRG